MSDREALVQALEHLETYAFEYPNDLSIVATAAHKYLAQLPEKCEHGKTEQHRLPFDERRERGQPEICSGKVYPAEILARIRKALYDHPAWAVAVLDALNEETK